MQIVYLKSELRALMDVTIRKQCIKTYQKMDNSVLNCMISPEELKQLFADKLENDNNTVKKSDL